MKTKSAIISPFVWITTGLRPVAKRFLIILALSSALFALRPPPCALSQIPQGFNYQAIARDGSGNPITSVINVKIAILTSESDLDVIWEEEHTVSPDSHGLFSIVVGKGTTIGSGLASYSLIDWTQIPLYIMTKINDVKLGVTQLWSVPYSMVSGDLGGSVKKLEVMGEDETSDEALFEVKRKDGELMFGVYNHGVRVYMPLDTLSKTRKGGFVVGGFDNIKGIVQDYLVVNPDSIRAYIDTNPGKTRKGGFAVGGFDAGKQTPEEYLRVTRDSTRIYLNDTGTKTRKGGFAVGGFDRAGKQYIQDFLLVSSDSVRVYINETDAKTRKGGFAVGGFENTGKGFTSDYFNISGKAESDTIIGEARVLWYPRKEAFMAGNVIVESVDSVGTNSWASGYQSKAIGNWSQALGYNAVARGDYSTAIGKNAVADSINSFSFGDGAKANGLNSFSFGQWAKADSTDCYSFGRGAIAKGFRSFALGSAGVDSAGVTTGVAYASGDYSFAIGQGSQSIGKGSIALGIADTAIGDYSTALGYKTMSGGKYSTSMGIYTVATGNGSIAVGRKDTASGGSSAAFGVETKALEWCSTSFGYRTVSSGSRALAFGENSTASGLASFSGGHITIASGDYSTALGADTKAVGEFSMATGAQTIASGMAAASFGWQTKAKGSRSLTAGNNTIASGDYSATFGFFTKARPFACFTVGHYNDTTICYNTTGIDDRDPIFIVGNGAADNNRSNALTVLKNGRMGIQVTNPNYVIDAEPNTSLPATAGERNQLLRFSSYSSNVDKLLITHNRISAGSDWTTAEFRIQKKVDATDMGYISFKANFLEIGIGANPHITLTNAGNVGIGTTSPGQELHVIGDAIVTGAYTTTVHDNIPVLARDLYVDYTGLIGILPSSERYKSNIEDMASVEWLYNLRPVNFSYLNDSTFSRQYGLIAEEVNLVNKDFVSYNEKGQPETVQYSFMISPIIKALQDQKREITDQKKIIESQQQQIDRLEKIIYDIQWKVASSR